MTTDWADEKAKTLVFDAYSPGGAYGRWVTEPDFIAQALRDERERAAKIAENLPEKYYGTGNFGTTVFRTSDKIAAAIREDNADTG